MYKVKRKCGTYSQYMWMKASAARLNADWVWTKQTIYREAQSRNGWMLEKCAWYKLFKKTNQSHLSLTAAVHMVSAVKCHLRKPGTHRLYIKIDVVSSPGTRTSNDFLKHRKGLLLPMTVTHRAHKLESVACCSGQHHVSLERREQSEMDHSQSTDLAPCVEWVFWKWTKRWVKSIHIHITPVRRTDLNIDLTTGVKLVCSAATAPYLSSWSDS